MVKFKVKDPFRKVEQVAKEHIDFIMELKDKDEVWSLLDHFFWEAFDKITIGDNDVNRRSKRGKKT